MLHPGKVELYLISLLKWIPTTRVLFNFWFYTKTYLSTLTRIIYLYIWKKKTTVSYWPSTQPSIKKQVHPVEDIRVLLWRVEFGALRRPQEVSDIKQLYNRVPQTAWVSWSQLVVVRVAVRGSENQLPAEGLSPQDPQLSSPAEWERSVAIVRGTWGEYVAVCSVSNSPLTHNPFATLSNKM